MTVVTDLLVLDSLLEALCPIFLRVCVAARQEFATLRRKSHWSLRIAGCSAISYSQAITYI